MTRESRSAIAYVDTSVVVAIAFGEREAKRLLRRLGRLDRICSSQLLEAEFRAAAKREGVAEMAATTVLDSIAWVFPDRPLTEEMSRVLAQAEVRGTGLWHLATALFLSPRPSEILFLTLDDRQAEAARFLGFDGLRKL